LKRPLSALLRAKNDPVGAWPQPGQARQADGASIARKNPQMNFRKTNHRGARHHPVVGRERDFEPAAKRQTIYRRDRWHGQIVERRYDCTVRADKSRNVFFRSLEDAGKSKNIGAHDKCILGAGDQNPSDRGRGRNSVDRAAQLAEC
jgi:hypothetical protein